MGTSHDEDFLSPHPPPLQPQSFLSKLFYMYLTFCHAHRFLLLLTEPSLLTGQQRSSTFPGAAGCGPPTDSIPRNTDFKLL